ncbi:hypothetical protein [Jannaschia formosa]|uniref:hypothetical protein n=1 Tax=Jannaschia formosa TaxID=2259592 RepID=UPI000E1B5EEB|nr:hypothetical protein [Jannaschia formosa]TFL16418.1 hypothetical protein DR046_20050 [Jannaschia formosa]
MIAPQIRTVPFKAPWAEHALAQAMAARAGQQSTRGTLDLLMTAHRDHPDDRAVTEMSHGYALGVRAAPHVAGVDLFDSLRCWMGAVPEEIAALVPWMHGRPR